LTLFRVASSDSRHAYATFADQQFSDLEPPTVTAAAAEPENRGSADRGAKAKPAVLAHDRAKAKARIQELEKDRSKGK
jgi:hypothetical protein